MLVTIKLVVATVLELLPVYLKKEVVENKNGLWHVEDRRFHVNEKHTLQHQTGNAHAPILAFETYFQAVSLRLRLRGMGFYFAVKQGVLFLITGNSHVLSFYIPKGFHIRVLGKRSRLALITCTQPQGLQYLFGLLTRFVTYDIYRLKGLFPVGASFLKKAGKKKFM